MSAAQSSHRPFDVIGLGTNAPDLIAIIDDYPEPDTKVQFQEFDVQRGGVIATAMAACARLGLRARYIGKVGSDFWSRVSLRTLSKEGIDVRHVIRVKGSPGHVSLVLADRATGGAHPLLPPAARVCDSPRGVEPGAADGREAPARGRD